MTPEMVDRLIGIALANVLDVGAQPMRAVVGTRAYRVLLERDGLRHRRVGQVDASSVRWERDGWDLPVDCDRTIGDDNALVCYCKMPKGLA